MIWKKFLMYLGLRKPDPADQPDSFNLKVMHGINRISIVMFLIALIIMFIKFVVL